MQGGHQGKKVINCANLDIGIRKDSINFLQLWWEVGTMNRYCFPRAHNIVAHLYIYFILYIFPLMNLHSKVHMHLTWDCWIAGLLDC